MNRNRFTFIFFSYQISRGGISSRSDGEKLMSSYGCGPKLKKEDSYTSSRPLGLQCLFFGELRRSFRLWGFQIRARTFDDEGVTLHVTPGPRPKHSLSSPQFHTAYIRILLMLPKYQRSVRLKRSFFHVFQLKQYNQYNHFSNALVHKSLCNKDSQRKYINVYYSFRAYAMSSS
jgi:hypothetical protein